tara:strand:+ start:239 stop:493 length:255 start_codon:yes stop_codon:yes gene_type:complete
VKIIKNGLKNIPKEEVLIPVRELEVAEEPVRELEVAEEPDAEEHTVEEVGEALWEAGEVIVEEVTEAVEEPRREQRLIVVREQR